ncbi:MAG: LPS assembly lipoprotein LptE [Alphaproteobacteria bacterium]
MSSLRHLLVVGCLTLAACGFEPLYGDRTDAAATEDILAFVSVPPIANRTGQMVRIELTNRLTPTRPSPPSRYTLNVKLTQSKVSLAVKNDASATRANLTITASFELLLNSDSTVLTKGFVRSVNGYDILLSDFATLSAEADARRRGAKDISDGIVDRLAIYMARNAQALSGERVR